MPAAHSPPALDLGSLPRRRYPRRTPPPRLRRPSRPDSRPSSPSSFVESTGTLTPSRMTCSRSAHTASRVSPTTPPFRSGTATALQRGQLAHQQARRITVLAHPPVPRPPGPRRRPLADRALHDKVPDIGHGTGPARLARKSIIATTTPWPSKFSLRAASGSQNAATSSAWDSTAANTTAHTRSAPESSPSAQRRAVSPSTAHVRSLPGSSSSSNHPAVRAYSHRYRR